MKTSKIFWGLFFIVAAGIIIANQLGYFFNVGIPSLFLTLLLIPILIKSITKLNFFGVFFPLGLLSLIYAKPIEILLFGHPEIADSSKPLYLTPVPVLLAALFLSIGFSIIFSSTKNFCHINFHGDGEHKYHNKFNRTVDYVDDNELDCKVSFGASSKYIHSQDLQKAYLKCSFGALEVYFDDAQLNPEGAEIFLDCSFGAIEMYVPKEWRIIEKVSTSLGGIDINNRRFSYDENSPTLTLTGNISFGGVDVKSI